MSAGYDRDIPEWRETLGQALNLFVMLALLFFAVGAVCEISARNEDYQRVTSWHQWLVDCRKADTAGCPSKEPLAFTGQGADNRPAHEKRSSLENLIEVAGTQVRRYDSLNSIGTDDRCAVAAIFASTEAHLYEDCHILRAKMNGEAKEDELHNRHHEYALRAVLDNGWFTYSGQIMRLDQRPKEPLYLFLVLASAAIGSLLSGLQSKGVTTLRDFAAGLGAGFAVYMLLRGGNFVFFIKAANVDALNPFSAAAAGLLVGLFTERALKSLGQSMSQSEAAKT